MKTTLHALACGSSAFLLNFLPHPSGHSTRSFSFSIYMLPIYPLFCTSSGALLFDWIGISSMFIEGCCDETANYSGYFLSGSFWMLMFLSLLSPLFSSVIIMRLPSPSATGLLISDFRSYFIRRPGSSGKTSFIPLCGGSGGLLCTGRNSLAVSLVVWMDGYIFRSSGFGLNVWFI